jgi:hypothetical protein
VALLIGGWLTLAVPDSHRAAGPQVVGLAVFAGLWLSAVVRPVPQPAVGPPKQRLFQQVVAQRRERERARERDGKGG